MKIKLAYFFPVPVFYVSRLGDGFAGKSFGFFILIKKLYKNDIGLLKHELMHCKQFYRTLGIHAFLYKFSRPYRYQCELEAYKEQLRYSDQQSKSLIKFATFLATKYDLPITIEDAKKDLLI